MAVMPVEASKPVLQTVGKYELLDKIAEGGMGTVYKARDREADRIVAIKIVTAHVAKNPVLMKRFEQEYRVASDLDHPNIVRALDFGFDNNRPYLVMEYVDGESLGQRIERDGRIAENEAIRLIAQIAQALHKAHKQGIVHRDVKPDNVIVSSDGVAKLADLGLVKESETDLNLTRTGRGLGTPHFMAPEQFRDAKNADARCDIYSLGATLYHMVTGELPFKSNGPLDAWMKKINNELVPARQIVPDLSERVDWALRRAMAVEREKRPASCREFVEDLTGQSTRKITSSAEVSVQDVWYLVFTDEDDVTRTVKGTLQGIRRSLKDGVLGDASNIRAARSKAGPFEALRTHPEFRDLVVTLEQATPRKLAALKTSPTAPKTMPASELAKATKSTRSASVTTPAEPTDLKPDPQLAPHFDLTPPPSSFDWAKWIAVVLCAASVAGAGYFLLPHIIR
jgi:eukaryotic-like serine/threonine-protein kinase